MFDFGMTGAKTAAPETAVNWVLVSFVVNPGDGHTAQDGRITAGMVCADMVVSDAAAVAGAWKVQAGAGQVKLTGTVAAPAIVNLLLVEGRLGVDGTEQRPVQADMGGMSIAANAAARM